MEYQYKLHLIDVMYVHMYCTSYLINSLYTILFNKLQSRINEIIKQIQNVFLTENNHNIIYYIYMCECMYVRICTLVLSEILAGKLCSIHV